MHRNDPLEHISSQNSLFKNVRNLDASNLRIGEHIATLPAELLSEIFLWCCSTNSSTNQAYSKTTLTLTQISRSWRVCALSTPALWSYLHLRIRYTAEGHLNHAFQKIRFWCNHVKQHTIQIDMELLEEPEKKRSVPGNVMGQVEALIDVLLSAKSANPARKELPNASLRATLDARAILSSPDNLFPPILEHYCYSFNPARSDPVQGSIHVNLSHISPVIFGLEGHATLLLHSRLRTLSLSSMTPSTSSPADPPIRILSTSRCGNCEMTTRVSSIEK